MGPYIGISSPLSLVKHHGEAVIVIPSPVACLSSLSSTGAHHRWLVLEIIEARGCQPTEAGLGISPDGSARLKPQQQAAGQRERIARGLC